MSAASRTSEIAAGKVFPASRTSSATNCARRCSSRSAACSRIFAREAAGNASHAGCAATALVSERSIVDDAVDERGVRAVLQQAAYEIRQQILVRADRRVDAAGHIEVVRADHFVVEIGAHAVQALELERETLRNVVDRRDRMRVVRGERRVERGRAVLEQAPGAGEVRYVGVRLARVHRIAGMAAFLRTLDFRIPVRALDQTYAEAAASLFRLLGEPVDHEWRAFLVGLDGETEALVTVERGIGMHGRDQVE